MADSLRLLRRNGTYYYRCRVPLNLVEVFDNRFIQFSPNTSNLKHDTYASGSDRVAIR